MNKTALIVLAVGLGASAAGAQQFWNLLADALAERDGDPAPPPDNGQHIALGACTDADTTEDAEAGLQRGIISSSEHRAIVEAEKLGLKNIRFEVRDGKKVRVAKRSGEVING